MNELFYKSKKQLTGIIEQFSNAILSKKKPDAALYSRYRVFKYRDELDRIKFDYKPEQPEQFIEDFSNFFENAVNFDAPGVMYNVHPNPNIYGETASFFASLANPNFCMDLPAGKLLVIEKAVVNYLNELAGWSTSQASGIFTFGGKGTLLYALKIALNKVDPEYKNNGIKGKHFVISNDLGHPSHIEICNWLGIGKDQCIRLSTTTNATVSIDDFKQCFIKIIKDGGRLPLIILNGMTTNNHSFDDVKAIRDARDEVVKQYKLNYVPHIHVDSVLGWVYLLLSRYNFKNNPLGIKQDVLEILQNKSKQAQAIQYADSFAADFHKTGYCSYISSAFLVKDKNQLFNIEGGYSESEDMVFSEYAPYDYSLESSRSPHGPVSAFGTLKTLGVEGFVRILANHTEAYLYLKNVLQQHNSVVCNYEEASNLVFLIYKPDKYIDLEITEDTPDEIANEIKEFNTGFYSFLLEKSKRETIDLFFSCSRSYKYKGKSYGSLKLYSFNSHLDRTTAIYIHRRINELFNEYVSSGSRASGHRVFDYAELKGVKHV